LKQIDFKGASGMIILTPESFFILIKLIYIIIEYLLIAIVTKTKPHLPM